MTDSDVKLPQWCLSLDELLAEARAEVEAEKREKGKGSHRTPGKSNAAAPRADTRT